VASICRSSARYHPIALTLFGEVSLRATDPAPGDLFQIMPALADELSK
jgi:hypothetical protein